MEVKDYEKIVGDAGKVAAIRYDHRGFIFEKVFEHMLASTNEHGNRRHLCGKCSKYWASEHYCGECNEQLTTTS